MEHDVRYPDLVAGEDPVFLATALTVARTICVLPAVTYWYRQEEVRPQPSSLTVRDYICHAYSVREIYGERFRTCWEHYRSFIKPDMRLLLSQASLANHERDAFAQAIEIL